MLGVTLGMLAMACVSRALAPAGGTDVEAATGLDMITVKPPRANCTKLGSNCMSTGCCAITGYKCYKQSGAIASCLKENTCGMKHGKIDSTNWDCSELKHEVYAEVVTTDPGLFCFEVALVDVGTPKENDYSIELIRIQAQTKTSIFGNGCAEWAVYSDQAWPIDPVDPALGTSIVVQTPHIGKRKTGAWINTPTFMNVWRDIGTRGGYANYEFTVKIDPDAVFFPYMLYTYLVRKPIPFHSTGTYIVNCRYVKDGFFGSMEVFSQAAFTKLIDSFEVCKQMLPWMTKGKEYGEDKFAEKCLEEVGVLATEDYALIQDAVCDAIEARAKAAEAQGTTWTELSLQSFIEKPVCDNKSAIAFHPVKKPAAYSACISTYQSWYPDSIA